MTCVWPTSITLDSSCFRSRALGLYLITSLRLLDWLYFYCSFKFWAFDLFDHCLSYSISNVRRSGFRKSRINEVVTAARFPSMKLFIEFGGRDTVILSS